MEKNSKTAANGKQKESPAKGVKAKSDAAQGLRDLFEDELKDIYWAEKELTKAIPKMIKNTTSEDLVEALTVHLEETKKHVTRLEDVFTSIGVKAQAKKCEAMAGLTKEAGEIMEGTEAGVVRDAGIILAGQKVEHYEIATYGTLASFAKTLGENEAASLLEETLNEEKAADKKLSEISDSINVDAAEEDEQEIETPVATKRK
ncbi:MAG: ferritin-like domain-containing protein [Bacteroidia bacterium]